MNEDYVDYQTALALKKAGFNYPCHFYYTHTRMRPTTTFGLQPQRKLRLTTTEAPAGSRILYRRCCMRIVKPVTECFYYQPKIKTNEY